MKKNNVLLLILSFLNFAICFCLLVLCVPNKVPFAIDLNEKIIAIGSKWILILNTILPIVLAFLVLAFNKFPKIKFVLQAIFILTLYENMLTFSYFSIEKTYNIGELSQIPMAVSLFMPLSVLLSVLAIKLKTVPYNNVFGIKTKYSTKTEFIWKQTHIYASQIFFANGVLLFLISIIFVFVRLPYIPLIITIFGLVTCFFITNRQSKDMYNKYIEMEKNKNKYAKKK